MSISTAVFILGLIMMMVIVASILQAADKRRRERARQLLVLRQRSTMLQDLLVDDAVKALTPRLRLLVLHKLLGVYRQLLIISPRDESFMERIDQTRVMISATQEQVGNPFEPDFPTTKSGLSEARGALRTVGKLLNNMIEAKAISPRDSSPIKFDLQNSMLELQVFQHDQLAKEAELEKKYVVAVHNLSSCINLLQRSTHFNKLERMEDFRQRLVKNQDHVELVKEANKRERERREKDWQEMEDQDGIFLKKHAYDD